MTNEWVWSPTSGNCFRRDALGLFADNPALRGIAHRDRSVFLSRRQRHQRQRPDRRAVGAYRMHGRNIFRNARNCTTCSPTRPAAPGDSNAQAKAVLVDHLIDGPPFSCSAAGPPSIMRGCCAGSTARIRTPARRAALVGAFARRDPVGEAFPLRRAGSSDPHRPRPDVRQRRSMGAHPRRQGSAQSRLNRDSRRPGRRLRRARLTGSSKVLRIATVPPIGRRRASIRIISEICGSQRRLAWSDACANPVGEAGKRRRGCASALLFVSASDCCWRRA